jgi:hypothetical protein
MANAIATVGSFGLSVSGNDFRRSEQTFVKIPGGGVTKWSWSTILGDQVESEITGVIVALSEVQHDLWPHQGTAAEKSSPYMRSLDGKTATIIGDDAGDLDVKHIEAARIAGTDTYDCSKIKYFLWDPTEVEPGVWKSGEGKISPRANATSVIGILRPGESAPLFIRLSKTSSPKVQKFARELRGQGVQPYQCLVSLGLQKVNGPKANYSIVVPKFVSPAPAEMVEAFRSYFVEVSPKLRGSLEKYVGKLSTDAVPF